MYIRNSFKTHEHTHLGSEGCSQMWGSSKPWVKTNGGHALHHTQTEWKQKSHTTMPFIFAVDQWPSANFTISFWVFTQNNYSDESFNYYIRLGVHRYPQKDEQTTYNSALGNSCVNRAAVTTSPVGSTLDSYCLCYPWVTATRAMDAERAANS